MADRFIGPSVRCLLLAQSSNLDTYKKFHLIKISVCKSILHFFLSQWESVADTLFHLLKPNLAIRNLTT